MAELKSSEAAEFVATAAHELKTPLTILIGMTERLRKHSDLTNLEIDDALDSVERQNKRLKQLVETLLDLGQLKQGYRPRRERTALAQIVADALELVPTPERTTVSLHDRAPGLCAWGNRMDLGRVLVNLLTNAYRYGGRHISIEIRRDGREAVMAVSDDGPGVPDELAPDLFHPFTRGDLVGGRGGSGLGLALSRRLMEALGGSLSYLPQNPCGCRFEARSDVAC